MVDDLLLEQRRAQRGQRVRVVAVEVEDFLLLVGREAAHLLEERALHLLVGNL